MCRFQVILHAAVVFMETTNLTSKMISSASYDVAASSLLIKLNDGSVRRIKAPRIMYENLISAESPGWYYMRHIRPLISH
ncbi:hypothetical protein ASG03_00150 [Rhizobium sp. Leaf341]|nr:hypothetical protein ASG03_00150 [Rhizobium sp. Leaf341]